MRHFDYTWCRSKPPGDDTATPPHYDIVFMGRGTQRLYTSWTPLGDIPVEMGGLMVLENSHRLDEVKADYGTLDVDAYCTNYPDAAEIESRREAVGSIPTAGRIRWTPSRHGPNWAYAG